VVVPNTAICRVGKGVLSRPEADMPLYRPMVAVLGAYREVSKRRVLSTTGAGSSGYLKDRLGKTNKTCANLRQVKYR
jgi:hypothetical protein